MTTNRWRTIAAGVAAGALIAVGISFWPAESSLLQATDVGEGHVISCTTDSLGGCTVPHGLGVVPTVTGTASGRNGPSFVVIDPANTTAATFRATLFRDTGARLASTPVVFTVHYDLPQATTPTVPPTSATPSTTPTSASPTPAPTTPAPTTPPAPEPLRPTWQTTGTPALTFVDEFNDTTVDTTKWERGWFGEGLTDNVNSSNDNCYHSNQVSESGGFLHLVAVAQPNTCKGVLRPYTSGMVTTRGKFTTNRGMFEARVCLPDADGNGKVDNFPAWWVNGMASGFADGEIDIVEGLGGGNTKATVHYDASHISAGKTSPSPLIGCHNFGAEWRTDSVKFYWDGALFFDTPFVVPASAQLVLILNQAVDDSHSPTVVPAGGNDMTVDWVRAWA